MKKVIIIGATSGIGKALAIIFIQQGAVVGITGRRQGQLAELSNQFPGKVVTECFDVREAAAKDHFQMLINKLGGMDILVYNAGYGEVTKTLDWEVEWQTIQTNVNGFAVIVNTAFNYFAEKGKGQVVSVSSIASIRGNGYTPAYSASKAYISIYMEGLYLKAKWFKKTNPGIDIVITDVQPGFVNTKMAKGHGLFWVSPVDKAALQIYRAIRLKKRRAYITRRWGIIAWLMKHVPFFVYKKIAG
jgi:short-subunit dehydrogenase